MYGISVFLGEEITNDTIIYIKKMKALGFDGIFTSLHIPEDDTSLYRQRLTDLGAIAKAEKMKIMVDISGEALKMCIRDRAKGIVCLSKRRFTEKIH